MSDTRIKDGTGGGSLAKVDNDNRLWTAAITKDTLGYVAKSTGYSFTWKTFHATLPGVDTEYTVLRIKNTDSSRDLFLHRFLVGWNGGSTTFTRTVEASMYAGTPAPTANYSSQDAASTNFGTTLSAPSEAQVWNGVGNGMTVAYNGIQALHSYFEKGTKDIILGGTLVVPFGVAVGFTVKSSEIGDFSLLISGWFEEKS